MATLMDSTTTDNNKYENNVITYITVGNLQISLPPSISIKSLPDGSKCLFTIDPKTNKAAEIALQPEIEDDKQDDTVIPTIDNSKTITGRCQDKPESYKCKLCNVTFEKVYLYNKHVQNHRNMKKFKCDQCYESFDIEDNFKIHLAMHSKGQPRCPICNRTFQRLASLRSHLLIHQVDETYTCQECLAEFEKFGDYNKHMEKHKVESVPVKSTNMPYVCSYCNYTFHNSDEYKEHISRHIKVKKLVYNNKKFRKKVNSKRDFQYKCSQCSKSFSKVCLLERHMRTHSGERPFICLFCNKGFAQKGTLQIHLANHTGRKPFACYLCPAKFCQKGNLRVHVERAHTAPPSGEKLYTCSQCTCIFKKVASLNAHITRCHSEGKKNDVIADVMQRLKQLEQHTLPMNNVDVGDQSLTESDLTDGVENNDKQNTTTIHSNINGIIQKYVVKYKKVDSVRWYICSFCGKDFKKPSDLIRHIRTHTKEKPFKCPQCDMHFTLNSTLNTHMKTHKVKKDYKCLLCPKILTSHRSFNLHLRKHDKNNVKTKQYKCVECNKLFGTLAKAKVHMKIHYAVEKNGNNKDKQISELKNVILKQPLYETGNGYLPVAAPKPKIPSIEYEQYKNRPCKCQHCPAAFTRQVHLKRHLLTHTGEKKFKCDYCQKSFYTSYALKEHINFHKGIKNFACSTCNKRFVTKTILKRHMVMHTPYTPYVCPYCKKRFKSVTLCRRHINIHKRDVNLQMQTLSETGELTNNLTVVEEPMKIIDFTTALSENVFTIPEIVNRNPSANFITTDGDLIESQTLDESQNIVIENTTELEKNASNYLVGESNFSNSEDISIEETNSDPNLLSTIYVNYENMQVLTSNDLNSLMKLENTDSLFLNTFHELQDNNVLMSLSQGTDFSNDNQNFDTFTTNFMLNTMNELNDKEQNQILSCVPEININESNNSKLIDQQLLTVDGTNLSDNLVLFSDTKTDLNFVQNLQYSLPKTSLNDTISELSNYACVICKKVFETCLDMDDHECTIVKDLSATENETTDENMLEEKCNRSITKSKEEKKNLNENENRVQKCPNCDKSFLTKLALYRHASTAHNVKKQTKNICTYCEKVFKKPSDLQRHVRTHTGEKPFKCEKCEKCFTLKSTRDSHYKTHNPGTNRDFNCTVCNLYFCSKSSLKTHTLKHTGAKPFACHLCPAKFRTSGQRKSHIESHKKNMSKGQSNINTIISSSKPNIEIDLDEANMKNDDLVISKTDLVTSENFQLNITENGECLNITPLLHLQNGVFLLNDIQADNTFASNLLQQLDIDCGTEEEVTPLVNIQTLDLSKIGEHEVFANNDSVIEINQETVTTPVLDTSSTDEITKPFKCDICEKRFLKRFLLNKHMKTHGLNLPYSCAKCKKGFANEHLYEKHLKSHLGFRPYACHLCNNSFGEEGSLKIHLKRLHNII